MKNCPALGELFPSATPSLIVLQRQLLTVMGSFAAGDSSAIPTCTRENLLKSSLVTKPKTPTENHLCLFVYEIIIALQPAALIKVNYLDKLKNLCSFTNGHKMKSQLL